MKEYPKTYENVYVVERILKKCKIEKVSIDTDMGIVEYQKLMRETVSNFQKELFDFLVKITWLGNRFCYCGYSNQDKNNASRRFLDAAFGVFTSHYVGIDTKLMRQLSFLQIMSYFKDFFPDFNALNPFEENFEYPYKNITLEYLIVVSQMSERLELLKEAEEKNMPYTEFLDYIINYVNCYNEEAGKIHYIYGIHMPHVPYVQVKKNKKNNYEDRE